MLLDANAQVGSIVSEAIGPHAQEPENSTGTIFREFLEAHSLCAPATFYGVCGECLHSASEPTWTSPRGFSRRIDYVVVPQAWRTACARPRVDANFVTLNVDHRPVCVDVRAHLIDSVPQSKRPGLPRHTDGSRPDGLCRMRLALWVMPPVAWAVNVHDHTAYVYEAARTGAARLACSRLPVAPAVLFLTRLPFFCRLSNAQATRQACGEASASRAFSCLEGGQLCCLIP